MSEYARTVHGVSDAKVNYSTHVIENLKLYCFSGLKYEMLRLYSGCMTSWLSRQAIWEEMIANPASCFGKQTFYVAAHW